MANTEKDVLVGSSATVWLDGEELGTWTNIEATITVNYEDVQIGYDVMRKAVSWQGDGSISHQATNSIGVELFNKIKANKDKTFVIECEIVKEGTGETQSMTLNRVTFDSIPLVQWGKGEVVAHEMSFRYAPSTAMANSVIA